MYLSGDLKGFPVPEVLSILGTRTGRVRFKNGGVQLPNYFDLYLGDGQLFWIYYRGQTISDFEKILSILVEIACWDEQGEFEFLSSEAHFTPRRDPISLTSMAIEVALAMDNLCEPYQDLAIL
jgi:hypothetical protein